MNPWLESQNIDRARAELVLPIRTLRTPPAFVGSVTIEVALLDAGSTAQATLSLTQEVVDPAADAEALIDSASNAQGPCAGNPEVLRELVNEHARYYQAVTPRAPEAGDAFRRLVFSFVWDGAQRRMQQARAWQIERLAIVLNEQPADFAGLAAEGVGVSELRLGLMTMTLPATAGGAPHLPWTDLPNRSRLAPSPTSNCAWR